MTNENNDTSPIEETGINRKFFESLVESSNLSPEDKKGLGEFKDFKNDTVGEVLKKEDKPKIKAYEELKVKDLPTDWELKLARIKEIESHEADYLQKKEELKVWTDTFKEKTPSQIQEVINLLEEKNKEISEELITEKEKHALTEKELKEWEENFLNQSAFQLKEKVNELEAKVKEWTQFFDYRELEEIKQEITELRKRPELPISEQKFWDDYAQRKSLEQSDLDMKALEEERKKSAQLESENNYFRQCADRILENIRIRRYALSKPVITVEDSQLEITNLLERTRKRYEDYLKNNAEQSSSEWTHKELDFELSIYPNKKNKIKQVLEWIKNAQETQDYKKLYELWNGEKSKEYNIKNDFVDGSLSLLKKYLEVIDEEFFNNNSQIVNKEEEDEILVEPKEEGVL